MKLLAVVSEGQSNNPHPGVGQAFEHDEKTYHAYYQWVPFVLFLQVLSPFIIYIIDFLRDFLRSSIHRRDSLENILIVSF